MVWNLIPVGKVTAGFPSSAVGFFAVNVAEFSLPANVFGMGHGRNPRAVRFLVALDTKVMKYWPQLTCALYCKIRVACWSPHAAKFLCYHNFFQ